MDSRVARLPKEFRRRDIRDPHLEAGETLLLDFVAPPHPGDIILVKQAGVYTLAIAPAAGDLVAVVRVAAGPA